MGGKAFREVWNGWCDLSLGEKFICLAVLLPLIPLVGIVISRMGADYDIGAPAYQHMAMIDQILQGKVLYAPLSSEYSCVTYNPLYWYISAAFCKVFGMSFLWPRLVSLMFSAGCAGIMFMWTWRLTAKDLVMSMAAPVMVLSTAFLIQFWVMEINVNALHVFLVLLGFYLLIEPDMRKTVIAAIALTASFFTKQTALAYIVAAAVMLLFRSRRHLPLYLVTCVIFLAAGCWYLEVFEGDFYRQTIAANQGPPWMLSRLFSEVFQQVFFGMVGCVFMFSILRVFVEGSVEDVPFFARIWRSEYLLAAAGIAVEIISHPKYGSGPVHGLVAICGITLCGLSGASLIGKMAGCKKIAHATAAVQVAALIIISIPSIPSQYYDRMDEDKMIRISSIFRSGRTCYFGIPYIQRKYGQASLGIPDDEPTKWVNGRLTYQFIPPKLSEPFAKQEFDYVIIGSYFDPNHPVAKVIMENYKKAVAEFPAHPRFPNSTDLRHRNVVLAANRLQK